MAESIELSGDELRAITGFAAGCARRVLPLFEQVRPDDPRPRAAISAAEAFAAGGRRTNALRQAAWAALRAARDVVQPAADDAAPPPAADEVAPPAAAGEAARPAAAGEVARPAAADYAPPPAAGDAPPLVADVAARPAAAGEAARPAVADVAARPAAAGEAALRAAEHAANAAGAAAGAAFLHPLASAHQVKHILGAAAHAALAAGDDGRWVRQQAPPAVAAVLDRLPEAPPGGGPVGALIRELDAVLRR